MAQQQGAGAAERGRQPGADAAQQGQSEPRPQRPPRARPQGRGHRGHAG